MWEPASQAPSWLDTPGPSWVLVTLSSSPQPEEMIFARTALQALAELPVRVVLTLSAEHPRDEVGTVPENARIEEFVSHSVVLKHSGLLVSHAGHGVVAKALYYGVPMVLVPWGRDQPGVASRAAALGTAEVLAKQDITADRLSAAIHRVFDTLRYKEIAARIAAHLQERDPRALARAHIGELLRAAQTL
jgi:MGT family glycosyltransferase